MSVVTSRLTTVHVLVGEPQAELLVFPLRPGAIELLATELGHCLSQSRPGKVAKLPSVLNRTG